MRYDASVATPPRILRLFVAAELPEAVPHALGSLQEALRRDPGAARALRWVEPDSIHLTLKFLGDVSEGRLGPITQALEHAVAARLPFALRFGTVGAFPSLARPRVLWLGLEGDLAALLSLQRSVEDRLAALGFPSEGRVFSPHLTLARLRQGQRLDATELARAASPQDHLPEATLLINNLALIQSTLRPQGPLYTRLWRGRLG